MIGVWPADAIAAKVMLINSAVISLMLSQYGIAVQLSTSLAVQPAALPVSPKFPTVQELAELVVSFVINTVAVGADKSVHLQSQPFGAVGRPITPVDAIVPVPTLIVKAAVPLL